MNQSEPAKQNEDLVIPNQPNILNGVVLEAISGLFKTTSSAPTGQAQKLSEQVRIYNGMIYFYDDTNDTWVSTGANTAVDIAAGSGEVTTSTNTNYTLGFAPSFVLLFAYIGGSNMPFSIGMNNWGFSRQYNSSSGTWENIDSYSSYLSTLYLQKDGSNYAKCVIANRTTPGFRLEWTVTNSPGTIKFIYLAFKS
jgi:hypothetical protein